MKVKLVSIIITLCMVFAIMPITALAANETVLDISQGNIEITNDVVKINGVATYASNENGYIITGTTAQNQVTVTAEKANITLSDLSIEHADTTKTYAFSIAKGSAVELTISGTNTLASGADYAGLWVPVGASVTIQSKTGTSTDSLTAKGGSEGAGIGGSNYRHVGSEGADCGEVTINSGKVEATGGNRGAGIGGGSGGKGGIVTISTVSDNSTVVTATGSNGGAGIGGGDRGHGGDITISAEAGGSITVEATGGVRAAGIGGGDYGNGGNITISAKTGGLTTVTATGGIDGAGIGGGHGHGENDCGNGGNITILAEEGGFVAVEATAGGDAESYYGDGAGIGGGNYGKGGTIIISSKGYSSTVVKAKGIFSGSGIGSGPDGEGANITISAEEGGSTKVEATGGHSGGAGIGGGYAGSCDTIKITGSTVIAKSPERHGIGNNTGSIVIIDSTIIASGKYRAIDADEVTFDYSVGYIWRTNATVDFTDSADEAYTWYSGNKLIEIQIPLLGISLDPTATVNVGETEKLAVTFDPYCASDKTIVWTSSNEDVATVDENGVVTAISEGVTTITATAADGTTVTCVVTVIVPVTGIILALNLTVGDTATLTATVAPENVTDKTITWTSSDESVATVDENGKITATGVGEATITATANGMTATFAVTVAVPAVPVTGIELSPPIALAVNDTEKLSVTFTPENAGDKSLTWTSSNESVATVDENGQVVAISVGTATIIATTSNGKTATCEVTVIVPVTGIELASTLALNVGETDTLTATIAPENATIKTITWTSSDETVATVDKYGQVTAIGAGEATITATTINGKTATCAVTVAEGEAAVEVASVTLDKATIDLTVGDTDTLTATIAPENAADKTVTWTSSDTSVATVDENGKITAIGEGTATITATTANGISATCTVSVEAAAEPTPEPEEPEETNAFLAFLRRIKSFFENIFRSLGLMK